MHTAHGYAAHSNSTPLVPHTFSRRDLRPNDVRIDILFCGVCHSDIRTVHGEWDGTVYTHGTLYSASPATRSSAKSTPSELTSQNSSPAT